jgi:hypothetical protein
MIKSRWTGEDAFLPRNQEETDDPEISMKRRLFLSGSNTVRLLSNLRAETGIFVLANGVDRSRR